jgi:hypothetical protein
VTIIRIDTQDEPIGQITTVTSGSSHEEAIKQFQHSPEDEEEDDDEEAPQLELVVR